MYAANQAATALTAARVVVDDSKVRIQNGSGFGGAGLGAAAIHAELGEIIVGLKLGREAPEQVTILGSVGLAFRDVAAGWFAYNSARKMQLGRGINLLS